MSDSPADAFRRAEYESLRAEIVERSKEQVWLESQVIIGSSVIYGALGTVTSFAPAAVAFADALWWMPVVLLAFGYFRWKANGERIHKIGRYVRTLDLDGWEKFEREPPNDKIEARWYWQAIEIGWVAAIAITAVVAVDRTVFSIFPSAG